MTTKYERLWALHDAIEDMEDCFKSFGVVVDLQYIKLKIITMAYSGIIE